MQWRPAWRAAAGLSARPRTASSDVSSLVLNWETSLPNWRLTYQTCCRFTADMLLTLAKLTLGKHFFLAALSRSWQCQRCVIAVRKMWFPRLAIVILVVWSCYNWRPVDTPSVRCSSLLVSDSSGSPQIWKHLFQNKPEHWFLSDVKLCGFHDQM